MTTRPRSGVAAGILLILIGLLFLAYQLLPGLFGWLHMESAWPLLVVAVGLCLLVFGLVIRAPGMAVPACIVSGIGLLLFWQNATGNWDSWAYAWALIPGFVGVGIVLTGLFGGGKLRVAFESGGWLILISLVMFAIFASFLGGLNFFGAYWPVLLILFGLLMMVRAFMRR